MASVFAIKPQQINWLEGETSTIDLELGVHHDA
jgi:hypothetical protein